METMLHPPRTALELYKILPEGTRCQLIHNHIIMSPSAKWKHQDLVGCIFLKIGNLFKKESCWRSHYLMWMFIWMKKMCSGQILC